MSLVSLAPCRFAAFSCAASDSGNPGGNRHVQRRPRPVAYVKLQAVEDVEDPTLSG
jgi:hypothetical protein